MDWRKIGIAAVATTAGFGATAPAQEFVVENYANACYGHALNMRGSEAALHDCDAAIASPTVVTGTRLRNGGLSKALTEWPNETVSPIRFEINMAATLINRGIVRFYAGDDSGALADFEAAAELQPGLAEPHVNAVLVHVRREDWASAIESLDLAMALNARNPARLYYRRGWAYEAIGDWEQALSDYGRAVELAPKWSLARIDFERLQKSARVGGS